MGTLNVYTEGEGVSKSLLFTKSGNQGDMWYNEEFDIPAMTNLKVLCATLDYYNSEVQSLAHMFYFLSDYRTIRLLDYQTIRLSDLQEKLEDTNLVISNYKSKKDRQ